VNVAWLAVGVAGAVVLGASVAGARGPAIRPSEARVFHAVNSLPGWLLAVLWVPMQLGNLVVGMLAGLVVAWAVGSYAVAAGVVLAVVAKLAAETAIRRQMAPYLSARQRPGTSEVGAVLRGGDVPSTGPSFPSGHVILVAAVAGVVTPTLPAAIVWLPFLLTAAVMVGRVYVGAHNPLDVTAGLGAGLLVGGILASLTL
jgi:undecaprenyl-diphosphatase